VLVDSLGLVPFQPAPEFGRALVEWISGPTEATHERVWRQCAYDLDGLRDRMGHSWEPFAAYNIDRLSTPTVQAALHSLMEQFGGPTIPPADLARIAVPTTLIWGRHDLATPLQAAETVSGRHGWPLLVIEKAADDPAIEQPEDFLRGLRTAGARRQP